MTACALGGGHHIEGVVLTSAIYGGPACLQHAMQALSEAALTPASDRDLDGIDRAHDARAEQLADDPNYMVPTADQALADLLLPTVTGGALAGSSSVPNLGGRAAPSPPRSPAEEPKTNSSPARERRAA